MERRREYNELHTSCLSIFRQVYRTIFVWHGMSRLHGPALLVSTFHGPDILGCIWKKILLKKIKIEENLPMAYAVRVRNEHHFCKQFRKSTQDYIKPICSATKVMIFPTKIGTNIHFCIIELSSRWHRWLEDWGTVHWIFYEERRQCEMNSDAASINIICGGCCDWVISI